MEQAALYLIAIMFSIVSVSSLAMMGLVYVAHNYSALRRVAVAVEVAPKRTLPLLYVIALYMPLSLLWGSFTAPIPQPFLTAFGYSHVLLSIVGCDAAWLLYRRKHWNSPLLFLNVLTGAIYLILCFGYLFNID